MKTIIRNSFLLSLALVSTSAVNAGITFISSLSGVPEVSAVNFNGLIGTVKSQAGESIAGAIVQLELSLANGERYLVQAMTDKEGGYVMELPASTSPHGVLTVSKDGAILDTPLIIDLAQPGALIDIAVPSGVSVASSLDASADKQPASVAPATAAAATKAETEAMVSTQPQKAELSAADKQNVVEKLASLSLPGGTLTFEARYGVNLEAVTDARLKSTIVQLRNPDVAKRLTAGFVGRFNKEVLSSDTTKGERISYDARDRDSLDGIHVRIVKGDSLPADTVSNPMALLRRAPIQNSTFPDDVVTLGEGSYFYTWTTGSMILQYSNDYLVEIYVHSKNPYNMQKERLVAVATMLP